MDGLLKKDVRLGEKGRGRVGEKVGDLWTRIVTSVAIYKYVM